MSNARCDFDRLKELYVRAKEKKIIITCVGLDYDPLYRLYLLILYCFGNENRTFETLENMVFETRCFDFNEETEDFLWRLIHHLKKNKMGKEEIGQLLFCELFPAWSLSTDNVIKKIHDDWYNFIFFLKHEKTDIVYTFLMDSSNEVVMCLKDLYDGVDTIVQMVEFTRKNNVQIQFSIGRDDKPVVVESHSVIMKMSPAKTEFYLLYSIDYTVSHIELERMQDVRINESPRKGIITKKKWIHI